MTRQWGGLTKAERSEVVRMERGLVPMNADRYSLLRAKAEGRQPASPTEGLACPYCDGHRGRFEAEGEYHCPDCGFNALVDRKDVVRYGEGQEHS